MAYFLEPGHLAMVMLTPEQYNRMVGRQHPSQWPVYFGARMAMQTIQDLLMKTMQAHNIDFLKENIDLMLAAGTDVAADQTAAGPAGSISALRGDIRRLVGGLYDNWKAGIFHGVGGAYASAMDNFLHTGQLIYAAKTLMYHTAITPRMRRHWNETFTPMVPSGSMAWVLYRRGHFTRSDFDKHVAWDGWDKTGSDLLIKAMELLPSPREAFYLWAKGQISEAVRNALYWAGGYDTRYHAMITENWYYVPTIYDLTRIADFVELDQIWATDMMKRRGLRDKDIAKIWEMLQIRPLRDEIRALTSKWLWRHKFGRATLTEVDAALTGYGVKPKERELLTEKAQLDYEDELIDEQIEILRWRFRTAARAPGGNRESFLDELMKLGINREKANLIVELEIAKGYMGYY